MYAARVQQISQWAMAEFEKRDPLLAHVKHFIFHRYLVPAFDDLATRGGIEEAFEALLSAARLAVADAGDVFNCIGKSYQTCWGTGCGVSHWNEQIALRAARLFIFEFALDPSAAILVEMLAAHAAVHLTPNVHSSAAVEFTSASPASSDIVQLVHSRTPDSSAEGKLVLARPVAAFSPMITVPLQNVFYIDNAVALCPLAKHLHTQWRHAVPDDETILILSFLFQTLVLEVEKSPWAEVLSRAPKTFSNIPTFWNPEVLTELEGMSVQEEVVEKLSRLRTFHAEIQQLLSIVLPQLPDVDALLGDRSVLSVLESAFSLNSVHWARAVMDSRAITLNVGGVPKIALVPVIDMVNHDVGTDFFRPRVELFASKSINMNVTSGGKDRASVPDGVVSFDAARSLGSDCIGREIFMTYGPLENWELLLSYGFVLDANENDRLPFMLDVESDEETDVFAQRRAAVRKEFNLPSPDQGMWIPFSGIPPPALLAHLRLQHATESDYAALEGDPFTVASTSLEATVVETVRLVVTTIQNSFLTSLDEDEDLLADLGEVQSPRRMCVMLRMGLKNIAERTLMWCEEQLRTP